MKFARLLMIAALSAFSLPAHGQVFLEDSLGLSPAEVETLGSSIIVKQLPSADVREVALAGVVRVSASDEEFIDAVRSIDTFVQGEGLEQVGVFSDPPQLVNVASLEVSASDISVVEKCRLGNCKFKLSASQIARTRTLDWSAPGAGDAFTRQFRQGLVDYVTRYLEQGSPALVVYADKPEPTSLEADFARLLAQATPVGENFPELERYLKTFPKDELPGAQNVIYWTVEDFGYRPITAVTHAVIYSRTEEAGVLVAEKQLYASHYLGAQFTLMGLMEPENGAPKGPRSLVYLQRSLFDEQLGTLRLGLLVRGLRTQLEGRLKEIRDHLETHAVGG